MCLGCGPMEFNDPEVPAEREPVATAPSATVREAIEAEPLELHPPTQ